MLRVIRFKTSGVRECHKLALCIPQVDAVRVIYSAGDIFLRLGRLQHDKGACTERSRARLCKYAVEVSRIPAGNETCFHLMSCAVDHVSMVPVVSKSFAVNQ